MYAACTNFKAASLKILFSMPRMRMDGNTLPVRAMHCRVEGTRSRGRQRKRWIDSIKEDLEV